MKFLKAMKTILPILAPILLLCATVSLVVVAWYVSVIQTGDIDATTKNLVVEYTFDNNKDKNKKNYTVSNLAFFDVDNINETKYISDMAVKLLIKLKNNGTNEVSYTYEFKTEKQITTLSDSDTYKVQEVDNQAELNTLKDSKTPLYIRSGNGPYSYTGVIDYTYNEDNVYCIIDNYEPILISSLADYTNKVKYYTTSSSIELYKITGNGETTAYSYTNVLPSDTYAAGNQYFIKKVVSVSYVDGVFGHPGIELSKTYYEERDFKAGNAIPSNKIYEKTVNYIETTDDIFIEGKDYYTRDREDEESPYVYTVASVTANTAIPNEDTYYEIPYIETEDTLLYPVKMYYELQEVYIAATVSQGASIPNLETYYERSGSEGNYTFVETEDDTFDGTYYKKYNKYVLTSDTTKVSGKKYYEDNATYSYTTDKTYQDGKKYYTYSTYYYLKPYNQLSLSPNNVDTFRNNLGTAEILGENTTITRVETYDTITITYASKIAPYEPSGDIVPLDLYLFGVQEIDTAMNGDFIYESSISNTMREYSFTLTLDATPEGDIEIKEKTNTYRLTQDEKFIDGKAYYTKTGTEGNYIYQQVLVKAGDTVTANTYYEMVFIKTADTAFEEDKEYFEQEKVYLETTDTEFVKKVDYFEKVIPYKLTEDETLVEGKTYYILDGNSNYVVVEEPNVADIDDYFELDEENPLYMPTGDSEMEEGKIYYRERYKYVATTDLSMQNGKTYYEKEVVEVPKTNTATSSTTTTTTSGN